MTDELTAIERFIANEKKRAIPVESTVRICTVHLNDQQVNQLDLVCEWLGINGVTCLNACIRHAALEIQETDSNPSELPETVDEEGSHAIQFPIHERTAVLSDAFLNIANGEARLALRGLAIQIEMLDIGHEV